jgi:hypothetical protein
VLGATAGASARREGERRKPNREKHPRTSVVYEAEVSPRPEQACPLG